MQSPTISRTFSQTRKKNPIPSQQSLPRPVFCGSSYSWLFLKEPCSAWPCMLGFIHWASGLPSPSGCSMCQYFSSYPAAPFNLGIMVWYMGLWHLLSWWWAFGLLPPLAVMKNAALDKYKLLLECVSMMGWWVSLQRICLNSGRTHLDLLVKRQTQWDGIWK